MRPQNTTELPYKLVTESELASLTKTWPQVVDLVRELLDVGLVVLDVTANRFNCRVSGFVC